MTATASPSSGRCELTGQSLPIESTAPVATRDAKGYCKRGAGGPQARHREVQLQWVELSPQRLDVGDHAELGEAREVAGVDQLASGR